MSSNPPSWQQAINALLDAAAAVVRKIGNVIAQNVSLIATVLIPGTVAIADNANPVATILVLDAVAVAALSVARRVLLGISGFFRGLF